MSKICQLNYVSIKNKIHKYISFMVKQIITNYYKLKFFVFLTNILSYFV